MDPHLLLQKRRILNPTQRENKMDDKHRTVLRRHWSDLRRDLEPKRLFPYMVNVLDESDEQEIKAQGTREEQVDKMLEILPRRGPQAFKSFVRAVEGSQPFLAQPLIQETELEEMRTELHAVRCHSAKLRDEISTVKGQLEGERSKKERTRKELEELKSMHQALLKQSKEEKQSFETKIRELKRSSAALTTELAQEKNKKEIHILEIKRLQELCDGIHENLKEKEKDFDELKKSHRRHVDENNRLLEELGQFSLNKEPCFERRESTGSRKKHSREESMASFIGLQREMTTHYEESDENKENLERTTKLVTNESSKYEPEIVESRNGTALEPKQEVDELFSKTLKEKEEAVRKCSELETLLHNAQARELEMRRRSLRDRATSFGDAPPEMNSQNEDALEDQECTKCKETEEMCTELAAEKDKLEQLRKKQEEQLGQATKKIMELKEKHQREKESLELDKENLRTDGERTVRDHANEVRNVRVEMTEQHLRDVKDIQEQKIELSEQIERDDIELNRLRTEIERERTKLKKQHSEFETSKKKLSAEKKQLKTKLELEVKARKKEASEVAGVLKQSEVEQRRLMDEAVRLRQSLTVDQDTINLLKEEISRWKTLPGRVFNFKKEFDRNGVIYALGTNFATSTWLNPASASAAPLRITVTRSSHDHGDPLDLLEIRKGTLSCTKDEEKSWWCVDLGEEYALFLTHYTLRHGRDNGLSVIRHWRLEGSLDGRTWKTLKKHDNDRGLKGTYPFYTGTWSIDGEISAMRYFRIFQTGKNSSGRFGLYLSGLELYGVLLELKD